MHALSLGTWWIHIASVLEWSLAIVLIRQRGEVGLAWAMLPAQRDGRLHLASVR